MRTHELALTLVALAISSWGCEPHKKTMAQRDSGPRVPALEAGANGSETLGENERSSEGARGMHSVGLSEPSTTQGETGSTASVAAESTTASRSSDSGAVSSSGIEFSDTDQDVGLDASVSSSHHEMNNDSTQPIVEPASCGHMGCVTPPQATCIDNKFLTYAAVGSCVDGACRYSSIEQTCHACGPNGCYCPIGTEVSPTGCAPCADGSYSADTDTPACTTHRICLAGEYVIRPGSATHDRECEPCPDGTYSTSDNEPSCTLHTQCVSPYEETTPPTSASDRDCGCPQTCGDGRCLALDECCSPATVGELGSLDSDTDMGETKTIPFCLGEPATVAFEGGNWQLAVLAVLTNVNGDVLLSFEGNGSPPVYRDVAAGAYEVTLTMGAAPNAGGSVKAHIQAL